MTPDPKLAAAIAAVFRRAEIVGALVDHRTVSHDQAISAARAAIEFDARGDRWAAEIARLGTCRESG